MNKDKRKYKVMFAKEASTYDYETKRYVPVLNPPPLEWDSLVKVILNKDKRAAKDGWGLIPSDINQSKHPKGGRSGYWRLKKCCTTSGLVALDIEEYDIGSDDPEDIIKWVESKVGHIRLLIYTSWNHGVPSKWKEGHPRLRIVIPLQRDVDALEEYPHLFAYLEERFEGAVDSGCKDPSRISYLFRDRNPEAVLDPWSYEIRDGDLLDPDDLPGVPGGVPQMVEAKKAEERKREEDRKERLRLMREGVLDKADQERKEKYLLAALSNITDEIRGASEGNRHRTYVAKAFKLGTMLQDPEVAHLEMRVEQELIHAATLVLPPERRSEPKRVVPEQIKQGLKATGYDWSHLASLTENAEPSISIWEMGTPTIGEPMEIGFRVKNEDNEEDTNNDQE